MSILHYEFDLFQRYSALKEIFTKLEGSKEPGGSDVSSVLDIGSADTVFTSEFLGDRVRVVRADTDVLDAPDVVRLIPGEPLPFADQSFDYVISMDVLEHVLPDQRAFFLREACRVARIACIVACPDNSPAVVKAETRYLALHQALFGNHRFMWEHRSYGLPDSEKVIGILEQCGMHVAVKNNVPLRLWEVTTQLDLLAYSDDEAKPCTTMLHQLQNESINLMGHSSQECYRNFYVACRFPITLQDDHQSANKLASIGELEDHNISYAGHIVVDLLKEWRRQFASSSEGAVTSSILRENLIELNGKLASERDVFERDLEKLASERDMFERDLEKLASERDAFKRDLEKVASERDELKRRQEARVSEIAKRALRKLSLKNIARLPRFLRAVVPYREPIARQAIRGRWQAVRLITKIAGSRVFCSSFYMSEAPQTVLRNGSAIADYVIHGWHEGRKPHPLFDPAYYLLHNPDVRNAGAEPLTHYLSHGWREGRKPHPLFDPIFYLSEYPDVAESGCEPLTHYIMHGAQEGRRANPDMDPARTSDPEDFEALARKAEILEASAPNCNVVGYQPPAGLLPWVTPLNIRVSARLAKIPHVNVLVPGLAMKHMSGGPNTAVNLAYRLASLGVPIRFIATDAPVDADPSAFWQHVHALSNIHATFEHVSLVDASDRRRPLDIGANDIFMATAWWTAQMAKYALRHTSHDRFVYLVQDYEPILHPHSSAAALATETYQLEHIPVVNTQLLKSFLVSNGIGRYAEPDFAAQALVFDPAVDRSKFYTESPKHARRTLLFYARPTNGLRNLFELGVAALQKAIHDGVLDPAEWDFVGIGEHFAPVPLGSGAWLKPAPWLGFDQYAAQMRAGDILLSSMLSPHPSYPPIEMAFCGKPVVTTTFANKTAATLEEISPNIIGVPATIEGLVEGLVEAKLRLDSGHLRLDAHGVYPSDWNDSFAAVVPDLFDRLLQMIGAPSLKHPDVCGVRVGSQSSIFPGYRRWPQNEYERTRLKWLAEREQIYDCPKPGLISFVTTVWNTDPEYLVDLAEAVFGQDSGVDFEWIVLDNGSENHETLKVLSSIGSHPSVRLSRIEQNIGIVRGMRQCLELASNRYIVPLDSDDLLTPDCVRVLTSSLVKADYPLFAYTDEDKLLGFTFRDPYCKPGWDPVLFSNSCYIAHLCAIDRTMALQLGAYSDPEAEGSHDWDTFTRFYNAGHKPLHIPEVLYTWRMHGASTAGNIASKPFIATSQKRVLERLLGDRSDKFSVEPSPFFKGTPDWVFKRSRFDPRPITTVVLGADGATLPPALQLPFPHEMVLLESSDPLSQILELARSRAESPGALIHILSKDSVVEGEEWPWDAMTWFDLLPDTAVVGGCVHAGGRVINAGSYFGFGDGCDSPDVGRSLNDPGYSAQMLKAHSVNAVPIQHCVASAEFLARVLPRLIRAGVEIAQLGIWLGAQATVEGLRVVYSPFFRAEVDPELAMAGRDLDQGQALLLARHAIMRDDALLSPRLGISTETSYKPVSRAFRQIEEREQSRRLSRRPYQDTFNAELAVRVACDPVPINPPRISLLTVIYNKTPLDCFAELETSLKSQTTPFFEWVILCNGPLPEGLGNCVHRLKSEARIRVLESESNLGIIGGLRRCLEASAGDWVLPVDGDDVLTIDALQQLSIKISGEPCTFVYSDEDILLNGALQSPYRRPHFDPILNAADSYVWHACTFSRDRALELGVYSDPAAEFCQDWDTLVRFALANDRILHVPKVLYHWRAHAGSFSNSGVSKDGSLRSVESVMNRIMEAQADPAMYEIDDFPISRGQVQRAILRRTVSPKSFDVLSFSADVKQLAPEVAALCGKTLRLRHKAISAGTDSLEDVASPYLMVIGDKTRVVNPAALWEAMRLFEMHPDVALVGGRILDRNDTIVESCAVLRPERPDASADAVSTFVDMRRADPGDFAIALKPQTAVSVPVDFFFAETAFVMETVAALPNGLDDDLATALVRRAASLGRRIAYSPLVEALRFESFAELKTQP